MKSANNYVIYQVQNPTNFHLEFSRTAEDEATFPDNFRNMNSRIEPNTVNSADVSISTYETRSSDYDLKIELFESQEAQNSIGSCEYTFNEALENGLIDEKQNDEWGVAAIFTVLVASLADKIFKFYHTLKLQLLRDKIKLIYLTGKKS